MAFQYSGLQAYNIVAYLADVLMTNEEYTQQIPAEELSYAIWTIFTPATAYGNISGDTAVQTAVVGDITAAYAATDGGLNYNGPTVTVSTPTSWANDPGRPQEYLTIQTPEASAVAYLAVDFTTVLCVLFVVRRRILRGGQKA